MEAGLAIKSVSSTQVQNNFGQVLDDVTQNHTRYIVERRGSPKAIILSFDDFARILDDATERQEMGEIVKELRPAYEVGHIVSLKHKAS